MSWLVLGFHNWRHGVPKIIASTKKSTSPLRLGVLGAAAINPCAIFDPVSTHPDVVISGIAARSKTKAEAQIKQYKLQHARAYVSYDDLLADPEIEAVYIPLPNGLHAEWTLKALRAGKHVLVEKPIASNAEQVREIKRVSDETGKVVLEAFHWRLHPAAHLVKSLVDSGDYGAVQEVRTRMALPAGTMGKDDIRFQYGLAGGSCMDMIYVYSATSYFAAPSLRDVKVEVQSAVPRVNARDGKIDEAMTTDYTITSPSANNGQPVHCHAETDLAVPWLWGIIPPLWEGTITATVELEKATIVFPNFPGPWLSHTITVTDRATGKVTKHSAYSDGPQWVRRGQRWWTTYRYQLEAFVDRVRAVQGGKSLAETEEMEGLPWVGLEESEAVMTIVDKVYEKAGLGVRM
ncbi:hypothetical protein B0A55_03839 [Friedmanniomyces simplex]|uniref:D-xylose 1-dehydrogenase (NADP(+), D-xylono-1,5-lactone-forming) n=1 Tax=Friedmanniomyces simplex TaxID=329884 RepID=A0A4U0XSQ8_9PEZI|nr:hypothetical protein B0A55_03839 [Friedmanniomyces simplex]